MTVVNILLLGETQHYHPSLQGLIDKSSIDIFPIETYRISQCPHSIQELSSTLDYYDIILIEVKNELSSMEFAIRKFQASPNTPPILVLCTDEKLPLTQAALQAGADKVIELRYSSTKSLLTEITNSIVNHAIQQADYNKPTSDSMIGLADRNHFQEKLQEQMTHTSRSKQLLAVLVFSFENQHSAAQTARSHHDKKLLKLLNRIKNCTRETDTIARIDAGSFALLATELRHYHSALSLAKGVIASCQNEIQEHDKLINSCCCVGIALFPDQESSASEILAQAQQALSLAKQHGPTTIRFANEDIDQSIQQEQELLLSLSHAIENRQLKLVFQPVIDANHHHIAQVEALLRWQHPSLGTLTPKDFLALFDQRDLSEEINRWVIKSACRQHQQWLRQGLPAIPISINLSIKDVEDQKLPALLAEQLRHCHFNPAELHLEIDEDELACASGQAYDHLMDMHDLGVHFTVDHFGKNMCSLTKLQQLPIDNIKIDRSLTQNIAYDKGKRSITKAIIQMGKALNIRSIAEGIDDPMSIPTLLDQQCDMLQGYAVGMPMKGEHFPVWHTHYIQENASHPLP
jgi:diguanylate cyclase (GGDEF)-like protein